MNIEAFEVKITLEAHISKCLQLCLFCKIIFTHQVIERNAVEHLMRKTHYKKCSAVEREMETASFSADVANRLIM